jgi:indole-3-glycerol phosphate synthase
MSVLEAILEHKREEVQARRQVTPPAEVRRLAEAAPPPRGFAASLRQPGMRVIAEVKRVSPAKGALRLDADAPALAQLYEQGGAAAISVLTDQRFFGGSDEDLRAVRAAVSLPVLRKDFLIDEYQVWEARALGADAVLLIVRALDDPTLVTLRERAEALGMDALVEVHTRDELERAAACGATLIGINNRDLATLRVDVANTFPLLPYVPAGVTVVSESGISQPAHTARLAVHGVHAVLIGEALVVADDPVWLLRELIAVEVAT